MYTVHVPMPMYLIRSSYCIPTNLKPNLLLFGGFHLGNKHPSDFYPGIATSILVWDTGRPNGDQRHPLSSCRLSGKRHSCYMPECTHIMGQTQPRASEGINTSDCKSRSMSSRCNLMSRIARDQPVSWHYYARYGY